MDDRLDVQSRFIATQLALWVGIIVGGFVVGRMSALWNPQFVVLLIIAAGFLVFALARTEMIPIIMLYIRSSLDLFTVLGFSLGFGLRVAGAAGIAVVAIGLIFMLQAKANPFRYRFAIPFLGLVVLQAYTAFDSINVFKSMVEVFRTLSIFFMFMMLVETSNSRPRVDRILKAVFFSSLIPVAVGLIQILQYRSFAVRLHGTMVHPNIFGLYLVIQLLLAPVILPRIAQRWRRAMVLLYGVMLIELLLTYSRGSWIVLIFGFCVIGWFRFRKFLWVIPLLAVVTYLTVPPIRDRMADIFDPGGVDKPFTSIDTRQIIWDNMWPEVYQEPLFGHGAGSFEFGAYATMGWFIASHDEYLRMAYETGFLGLGLFLAYEGLILLHLLYIIMRTKTTDARNLAISVLAIKLAILINAKVGAPVLQPVLEWYIWSVYAAAVVLFEVGRREEESEAPEEEVPEAPVKPEAVAIPFVR